MGIRDRRSQALCHQGCTGSWHWNASAGGPEVCFRRVHARARARGTGCLLLHSERARPGMLRALRRSRSLPETAAYLAHWAKGGDRQDNTCHRAHRRVSRYPQAPSRTACPGAWRTIILDRAATICIPQLPRPSAAMDLRCSRVGGRHLGITGRHHRNTQGLRRDLRGQGHRGTPAVTSRRARPLCPVSTRAAL